MLKLKPKETAVGDSDLHIPQKGHYILEMAPGRYAWCTCGRSAAQPFCDGSHKDTKFRPRMVEIKGKKRVAWCGCKHSKNKPFCDGSHKTL